MSSKDRNKLIVALVLLALAGLLVAYYNGWVFAGAAAPTATNPTAPPIAPPPPLTEAQKNAPTG